MMQKNMTGCRWTVKGFFCLSLFVLFGAGVSAQAQIGEMNATKLIAEADVNLKAGRYADAVPYLKWYLKKFGGREMEPRVILTAQDVRFKLAKILAKDPETVGEAIHYLEQYVDIRPAPEWHAAMKLLALSLLAQSKNPPAEVDPDAPSPLERCAEVTLLALAGPTNEINPVVEKLVNEDGQTYKYDEFGEIIIEGEGGSEGGEWLDASGYNRADMVILNTTLGEAYTSLGKVAESISPWLYVAEYETVGYRRGYAIMNAIEAMVQMHQLDEINRLIPPLYQTDARYDIRVNLAIMDAASSLFDQKRFDDALLLYRMIQPREVLIKFQQKKIRQMQFEAGIISANELTVEEQIEFGVDVTLLGSKKVTEEFFHERGEDRDKPRKLVDLEKLVDYVKNMPPYEQYVMFRNASLYDTVDRPWEAFQLYNRIWDEDSESDRGHRAFYEATRIAFEELGGGEDVVKRCYEYLDEYKAGLTPRQIAYLLTAHYQNIGQMASIKKLLPYLEGFLPAADPLASKYETELYYMQAIADMVMMEFQTARDAFKLVLDRYPNSHQQENCVYWRAMTLMYMGKYEDALGEFEAYLETYPEGAWVASANFQAGTCLFGLNKIDEAKARFTAVIEDFPDSAPYPDACSLRGDILASEEDEEGVKEGETKLDLAIADYREAIRAAKKIFADEPARSVKQATYATFQMCTVYDLLAGAYKKQSNEYYEKIITAVDDYLDFYGAKANISKGIYWRGKTRISQGRIDEAMTSYLDAIAEYGDDLQQDGVDLMISDLTTVARRRLKENDRIRLNSKIKNLLEKTDQITLQLRLRVLLAKLNDTEIELGKALIKELDDLSVAAPPVLSAISKASFELKDYSRAGEILKVFKTQFKDSEFIRPVFKLRAFDLHTSGKLDEALEIIEETQGRYGTDRNMAWAQLLKGEILIQQGKYDEAKKALLAVMNEQQWRGAPYAEAIYRLGQAKEQAGDPRQAFSWYQRAYFQYKGYAKGYWAAEAYLASARCLEKMGRPNDVRNTYRAMLFDKYVNKLPQADVAREALGKAEVLEIIGLISSGNATNVTVTLEKEAGE